MSGVCRFAGLAKTSRVRGSESRARCFLLSFSFFLYLYFSLFLSLSFGTPSARYTRVLPSRRVRFCSSCFSFCSFCSFGPWLFCITSRASPHADPPQNASARPNHARTCVSRDFARVQPDLNGTMKIVLFARCLPSSARLSATDSILILFFFVVSCLFLIPFYGILGF